MRALTSAGRVRTTALASGAVGLQVAAGGAAASSPALAVGGVVAVAGAVLLVVAPSLALVASLSASIGYWRAGPSSFNLSIADVALGAAFLAALPFVPWRLPAIRGYGRLTTLYLGVIAIPVAANPSTRTVFEWGHRGFLVGCALAVGAAIAVRRLVTATLRVYVATTVVFAVAAVVDAASRSWVDGLPVPAYPFGMQKNPAALLMAMAVLVVVVAPRAVALPRVLRPLTVGALFTGIAACQSRGAAIALVAVLGYWLVRSGRVLRSPFVLVGMVVLVAMTWWSFNALFQSDKADSRFNSVNSRLDTYDAALDIWRDHPIAGAGLKYWRDPDIQRGYELGASEPHNLVVAALGESGVIGLAALVVLVAGGAHLSARSREPLALLAAGALWLKAGASIFDIFWVAGTMTVPWLLIGIACGSSTMLLRVEAHRSRSELARARHAAAR
jgi:O-antigen ligase